MTAEENTSGTRQSFPALIAWLSTCLFVGGLGTMVDSGTHLLWLRAGSFGLVAAVGLDVSSRLRSRRNRVKHWRMLQRRCDHSLEMFVTERGVAEELRTAVTTLLTRHPQSAGPNLPECKETRWSCDLHVEVYEVRKGDSQTSSETGKVGVIGRMDNLSNSGFALTLSEQLTSRWVIIALLPPDEQEFDLLGEILWRELCINGQMRAGGRLLRVLPMGSRGPADCQLTETGALPATTAR